MSEIFVSFLQFYFYWNTLYNWPITSFVTLIKTFLHFITFFLNGHIPYTITLFCLIVVGGQFANFEQNSQQFSPGSISLQPPPLQLGTKQYWTSFVTFVKVFIEIFFETIVLRRQYSLVFIERLLLHLL